MALLVDDCVWEILERFASDLISLIDRDKFCGADDLARFRPDLALFVDLPADEFG
jgi:hypothetical protein